MISDLHLNGKLLLTGEYFVLDGARALAVPTVHGQGFAVELTRDLESRMITWRSYTNEGNCWFWAEWNGRSRKVLSSDVESANKYWFRLIKKANLREKIPLGMGLVVHSKLDFPRDWGLGSSSTLVAAIARWAACDPFSLLKGTFGGSGYDLPAAFLEQPYHFQWVDDAPNVDVLFDVDLFPAGAEYAFVHLGKKRNSRAAINEYRQLPLTNKQAVAAQLSQFSADWAGGISASELVELLTEHERLVGSVLGETPVREQRFSGFPGAVKSLGAWGGDFVLAVSLELSFEEMKTWFSKKGYPSVFYAQDFVRTAPRKI